MSWKKKKSRNQNNPINVVLLITALLQLISTILDLIEKLIA